MRSSGRAVAKGSRSSRRPTALGRHCRVYRSSQSSIPSSAPAGRSLQLPTRARRTCRASRRSAVPALRSPPARRRKDRFTRSPLSGTSGPRPSRGSLYGVPPRASSLRHSFERRRPATSPKRKRETGASHAVAMGPAPGKPDARPRRALPAPLQIRRSRGSPVRYAASRSTPRGRPRRRRCLPSAPEGAKGQPTRPAPSKMTARRAEAVSESNGIPPHALGEKWPEVGASTHPTMFESAARRLLCERMNVRRSVRPTQTFFASTPSEEEHRRAPLRALTGRYASGRPSVRVLTPRKAPLCVR